MKQWAIIFIATALAATLAAPAMAYRDGCEIEFRSEVAVSDKVIRIRQGDSDLVLTSDNRILVDYEEVAISSGQSDRVGEYASSIRDTVPEVVTIALEGAELGITALSEVAYGMFESEPPQDLVDAIEEFNTILDEHVRLEDGEYFLGGDRVSGVDEAMARVEPALEKAIAASIAGLFTNLGGIFSGGGDSDVSLMDVIARMQSIPERVEQRVAAKADLFEERAVALCEKMQSLDKVEQALHAELPSLKSFQLVKRAS